MEFKNRVTCLLRALLTLTILYGLNGRADARSTAAPRDMDIGTLVDDEDVQIINQTREGVSFFMELLSAVERTWCTENEKDVLMTEIRSSLLSDLNKECKCVQPSVSDIISKEKLECPTLSDVHYYGEIQHWISSSYSVQQLANFLDSWRPLLIIEGSRVMFAFSFNFTLNVTNSQTTMVSEDLGSGGGVNIDDIANEFGSGEISVVEEEDDKIDKIDKINKKPEQDKNFDPLAGGGTQGVHIVGSIVSLITGVSLLLSFVCLI